MKLIPKRTFNPFNPSHPVSLTCQTTLLTTTFIMGVCLNACNNFEESAPESNDLSAGETLEINSSYTTETEHRLTAEATDSEPVTCEVACSTLVECLTSECSELDPGASSQIEQVCLETCTPQKAEAITSQSCEENVAELSERQEFIAEACSLTSVVAVFNDETFDVEVTENVVFAQGLTHSDDLPPERFCSSTSDHLG